MFDGDAQNDSKTSTERWILCYTNISKLVMQGTWFLLTGAVPLPVVVGVVHCLLLIRLGA